MTDQPELVVVNLAMTLNVTPSQLASMMLVLTGGVVAVPEARSGAPGLLGLGARIEHPDQYDMPLDPANSLTQAPVDPLGEPASAEPPAAPKPLRAAPRPAKAKVNGKGTAESPPAVAETPPSLPVEPVVVMPPEPEAPMGLEDIRALLKQMSAAVPGRDATVLKMIEEVGGGLRVADCPTEKWPAIIAAARAAIAAHSG